MRNVPFDLNRCHNLISQMWIGTQYTVTSSNNSIPLLQTQNIQKIIQFLTLEIILSPNTHGDLGNALSKQSIPIVESLPMHQNSDPNMIVTPNYDNQILNIINILLYVIPLISNYNLQAKLPNTSVNTGDQNDGSMSQNFDTKKEDAKIYLSQYIKDVDCHVEALEILNIEGADENVQFKRGNTHYDKNTGKIKYTSLYCSKWKYKSNKSLETEAKEENKKESKSKLDKITKKKEDFSSYYRFKVDNDDVFQLVTFDESHFTLMNSVLKLIH